jgi:hypothetical protein
MSQDNIPGYHFTEGYHGTDEATGRKLVESGFDPYLPVHLAAPNQTYLAHSHGVKNAERTNSANYALIKAEFPRTHLKENFLGPDSLRLHGDDVDKIAIIGLSIYSRDGKLIEGEPVEVEFPREF